MLHRTTWIVTPLAIVISWTVGRFFCVWPEVFAAILAICLLGGVLLFVSGFGANQPRIWRALAVLCGTASVLSVVCFSYVVFANADAEINVAVGTTRDRSVRMPHKLRLFNLNVLHGYPEFDKQEYRFRATVGEIKRLDADILVLQETWNTVEHGSMAQCLSAELGFDCCYARANGSLPLIGFEEGSAILSRFPIKSAKRIVLKPKSPWWENRIALMAKIETGGGELTVVGVHLSYTSPDEQAECLLQNTSEHAPDIIAGDFNALPESGAMSAFRKRGFLEVVPANKSDEPWIDHVFLSPTFASRWEIKESKWISATKAVPDVRDAISDHDGILIDLQRR